MDIEEAPALLHLVDETEISFELVALTDYFVDHFDELPGLLPGLNVFKTGDFHKSGYSGYSILGLLGLIIGQNGLNSITRVTQQTQVTNWVIGLLGYSGCLGQTG